MTRPLPLKEIALQSGLSLATVDRVIHQRLGASSSAVLRVNAAINELERQKEQALLSGRRVFIDVIMEAPNRFSQSVRDAIEQELPGFRPASIRCRFHCAEVFQEGELAARLAKLGKSGSDGVIIKAADTPEIRAAVSELKGRKVPVVALVTAIGGPVPIPYVGMDNNEAGETAAWCAGTLIGGRRAKILILLSSKEFAGEQLRRRGFERVMSSDFSKTQLCIADGGFGGDRLTKRVVSDLLEHDPQINAVYSSGGGNRAILSAFKEHKRQLICFVGHDLDQDNRDLLASGDLNAVIHHDLRRDARSACQQILKAKQMLPSDLLIARTRVDICVRHNLPT